jgi:hypothetical protein
VSGIVRYPNALMMLTQRAARILELALLLAVFTVAIILIAPRGNFPLDDDWDFALPTWHFARTGQFHFSQFTAVSLRALVLWGALWTRAFGESFEVLRASTLTISAATIILVNHILARAGIARSLRIVTTLAFMFHPIFIWASCTYMTEVPYVFASMLAFLFFYSGISEERTGFIVAGCAAALVGTFVRETGVELLGAALAVMLIAKPRNRRVATITIGIAMALVAAIFFFRREWLTGSPEELSNHFRMWTEATFRAPEQVAVVADYTTWNAQNAALFFLPLSLILLLARRGWSRGEALLSAVIAIPILLRVNAAISLGVPMPYFALAGNFIPGNILTNWGLGPQTLSEVWSRRYDYPFTASMSWRLALTWGSALLAEFLVATIVIRVARRPSAFTLLAAAFAAAGTVGLYASGIYVDRYAWDSAWSVGLLLPMFVPWERRIARAVAIAALVAVAVFDVGSMQEYFSWNRARWTAYRELLARGVPPVAIDGGSEPFNLYEIAGVTQKRRRQLIFAHPPQAYVISFHALRDMRVEKEIPFDGWFGRHHGVVYVLRRNLSGTSY